MDEDPKPPTLSWETKAAIGALALLSLQALHEVYLVCVGILTGLLRGSRLSWWLGLILIGGIGLLHLAVTWHTIRPFPPGQQQEDMKRIATVIDHEWVRPSDRSFKVFWVAAKSFLLLSVPVALLSADLPESPRRPQ